MGSLPDGMLQTVTKKVCSQPVRRRCCEERSPMELIGIELVYTATNRSLAMSEVAVRLTMATLPDDYVMLTIHVSTIFPSKNLLLRSASGLECFSA